MKFAVIKTASESRDDAGTADSAWKVSKQPAMVKSRASLKLRKGAEPTKARSYASRVKIPKP